SVASVCRRAYQIENPDTPSATPLIVAESTATAFPYHAASGIESIIRFSDHLVMEREHCELPSRSVLLECPFRFMVSPEDVVISDKSVNEDVQMACDDSLQLGVRRHDARRNLTAEMRTNRRTRYRDIVLVVRRIRQLGQDVYPLCRGYSDCRSDASVLHVHNDVEWQCIRRALKYLQLRDGDPWAIRDDEMLVGLLDALLRGCSASLCGFPRSSALPHQSLCYPHASRVF